MAFNLSDFDTIVGQTSSILMLSGKVFGSSTSVQIPWCSSMKLYLHKLELTWKTSERVVLNIVRLTHIADVIS